MMHREVQTVIGIGRSNLLDLTLMLELVKVFDRKEINLKRIYTSPVAGCPR